jgi:CRP/FNR family transcriptional regulator, anaerobic regulatory protein
VSAEAPGRSALRQVLERTGPAPEAQWREFAALFRTLKVSKSAVWLQAGQQATQLGFLVSGLFRLYYTTADGKEWNKSFLVEGDFVASIHSLLQKVPSRLSIAALADAELLIAPYEAVERFYERDMYWQRLGRVLAERLVIKKLEREAALLIDTAAQRYEAFLREHPGLESRVPNFHIARYLGITPEALSRLRRARMGPPAERVSSKQGRSVRRAGSRRAPG